MTKQKVNITDIADKTGLSVTTVSRVLSGKAEKYRIGEKSQKKIREAAKELNYIPNHFAANLRSGRSETIALIVPSLNNPFFAGIASEINAEVRKFGYITIIGDSDENLEIEKTELQQMMARNIEGLVIVPCGNQSDHIKSLYDQGLPIVCIDRYFEDLDMPYVSTDNYDGAFSATKHLIENGHKTIACIQGVEESTPNRLRVKGFIDAMQESGLNSFNVVGDDFTIQNGYLETKLLLQQREKPTAIFTLSNMIALGCMNALLEENVRIPDEISLITFDDHPYLDYLSTPLSCIAQPVSSISKIAIKLLLSKLNNKDIKTDQILLKPSMKLKKSVKRIN
ncbi:LacI family DNA-binding transcriptional regulator [Prolixibacter sp. SD074]|uniref:LacI family DNA-binding transcriptional regulator n=1 Tax=Prolixibacter sp. SD074 TaxID=2652391 RepID=UPI0012782D2B|nr:LacI family DNA-binding transcriptional regulator [Prolixibacter sp. SD074]GET28876.1 LacI family transcriptional regulator [Prolixibacter sp. SD074]